MAACGRRRTCSAPRRRRALSIWADLNTDTGNANTSLNLTQFYPGISIHPATDQIIYGGTAGNDVQQFSGSLVASGTEACPYDGGYTAIDPQTPSTIYAACSYLGGPGTLTKNILNGVPGMDGINWPAIDNSGINFTDNADFIPPLVLDSKTSQNLYFGTYRLYQTMNGGTSWAAITSRPNERQQPEFRHHDYRGAEQFEHDLRGNFRWADLAVCAGAERRDGHSHGEPERISRGAA